MEEEEDEEESEVGEELEEEKDDSAVDIVKYGTYKEFAFFDEVRQLFISWSK